MAYEQNRDRYPLSVQQSAETSARGAFAVTISQTVDLPIYAKALKFNAAGTIYYLPVEEYRKGDETPVKWVVASAGDVAPIQAARVFLTNTTLVNAGDIIALHD